MADVEPVDLSAWIRRQMEDKAAAEQLVVAAYESAENVRLRAALLVEYRCRRCRKVLLHVWRSPLGDRYYRPDYTLSPGLNLATSAPAARDRKTLDGDHHWPARAGELDDLRDWSGPLRLRVQCKDVIVDLEPKMITADADAASPGAPTTRKF